MKMYPGVSTNLPPACRDTGDIPNVRKEKRGINSRYRLSSPLPVVFELIYILAGMVVILVLWLGFRDRKPPRD